MIIAVQFAAGGTQTWVAPVAGAITSSYLCSATAGRATISGDPGMTAAGFAAPAANSISISPLVIMHSGGLQWEHFEAFPVQLGEGVSVNLSAAGTVFFRFTPAE